jgi:hypothetical protein
MPEVYRSESELTQVPPEALVIYCSAARYQQHFEEFLVEGLKLEDYSLLAIPGGVHALVLLDYLPKFAWVGWRWLKFLVDADHPPRIVLIGHEDCRWYKHLFPVPVATSHSQVTSDLRRARQGVIERFPKVRVDLYYARLDPQGHVLFESV